ncbi:MAG: hypothetical protein IJ938_02655 [Clostridia bacterium]|nr:hypothetical protein [Clostridia bacterium]MBR2160195.1 hypothetical protein [Clostridia bacterium]MBR2496083.1 hypothetical protein [Clostridia bacterium]MBR2874532.1 hypothetical protein [Clostridia bacterium]MBR6692654.1 hypothetical protein [Clostridia bacterium]
MNKQLVQKLLNCEITWKNVCSLENCNSYLIELNDNTIFNITPENVIKAIQACLNNDYSMKDLIDWANVVRFSEIFLFNGAYSDCIISILDRIEESDEEGNELSNNDLSMMIDKLINNKEW